jgi:hypothetical protein
VARRGCWLDIGLDQARPDGNGIASCRALTEATRRSSCCCFSAAADHGRRAGDWGAVAFMSNARPASADVVHLLRGGADERLTGSREAHDDLARRGSGASAR